jgi:hypothetical protein
MILSNGRRPALLSLLTVAAVGAIIGLGPIAAAAKQTAGAPGAVASLASGRSAIYGGGPFYSGGQAVMDTLRSSGFTTVVLWTIHVETNGDLVFNDIPVVRNGQYIGDPAWPARLRTLKQAPTSVNRIEIGVGSWGVPDWERIHSLISSQGTGPSSILYRNFQALLAATSADAVNDDDESHYDVGSTTSFARMVLSMGYRFFTLAPYTNSGFWRGVRNDLGAAVDRIYLQVYAGGAGNNPATWNSAMGMTVDPGVWSRNGSSCSTGDSPATVQSKMTGWRNSAGIQGGFIWLFDDIQRCSSQGTAAQYAAAVNNAVGTGSPPPPGPNTGVPARALGKCLQLRGGSNVSGTAVETWDCNGSEGQKWTRVGDTVRSYGKCLDIADSGTANGSQIILWPCHGGQGQLLQYRADRSLFNPRSSKCLEIPNSNLTNGTRAVFWTCDARAKQTWTFG